MKQMTWTNEGDQSGSADDIAQENKDSLYLQYTSTETEVYPIGISNDAKIYAIFLNVNIDIYYN